MTDDEKAAYKWSRRSKSTLNFPYGTVLEMKVKILDGYHLGRSKGYGHYMMKVLEINGESVDKSLIFEFDNSYQYNEFPSNNTELHKYLYNEEVSIITNEMRLEMEKQYVGKVYNIAAYESGKFIGIPDGWGKYRQVPGGIKGLVFKNHLVIVTDLDKD
ncbi:MAG: hypothetical protein ABJP80_12375 [Algibacter sp.]